MLKSFRFWSIVAGVISIFTCILHVLGGGPEFHVPALQSALPDMWKAAFSTIWHSITFFLFFNGLFLIFVGLALRKNMLLLWLMLLSNLAFGALFFGYGIVRLNSPWVLQQWIIFAAISACTALAIAGRNSLQSVEDAAARPEHYSVLPAANFADTYIVHGATFTNAMDAARSSFGKTPAWIDGLMQLRHFIVRPFGLIHKAEDVSPNRIGIFPILKNAKDQVVLGLNDKHLDFRVVVELLNNGQTVSLTTLVKPHNFFGKVYLTVIMPFHRLIAATILLQAKDG